MRSRMKAPELRRGADEPSRGRLHPRQTCLRCPQWANALWDQVMARYADEKVVESPIVPNGPFLFSREPETDDDFMSTACK